MGVRAVHCTRYGLPSEQTVTGADAKGGFGMKVSLGCCPLTLLAIILTTKSKICVPGALPECAMLKSGPRGGQTAANRGLWKMRP